MDVPEVTSFDTHETQLYKLAQAWQVPVRMIIVLHPFTNSPEYINAEKIIRDKLDTLDLTAIETFLRVKSRKSWSAQVVEVTLLVLGEELNASELTFADAVRQPDSLAALTVKDYLKKINAFLFEQRDGTILTVKQLVPIHARLLESRLGRFNTITEKHEPGSLDKINQKVKHIHRVHRKYARIMEEPPLKSSNLIIVAANIRYAMVNKLSRNMPPASSIFTIFDNVKLSRDVPHLICKDADGTTYQKSYQLDPFEKPISGKYFLDVRSPIANSSFIFNIVDGNNVYTVYWFLETGYAEVNGVKGVSRSKVDQILNTLFLGIVAESAENSMTQYELRLYPVNPVAFDLKQYILLHRLVLEDDVFQFYLNESTSPYPYKKASELIFRYKPAWTSNNNIDDEVTFTMGLGSTMSDTNYITLTAESYSPIGIWRLFSNVIPAICIHFEEDLINDGKYAALYDKISLVAKPEGKTKAKPKSKTQLHQLLLDEFPEVFTEAYLNGGASKKKVHKRNLVKVTTDESVADAWRENMIENKTQIIPRSVAEFNDTEGNFLFWYTTVTPDTPYLRLMPNTREVNPKYPEVPGSSTAENESRKGKGETISANVLINSLTALGPDQKGVLPAAFDVILSDCQRRGVSKGPNSFLECVMVGKKLKKYSLRAVAAERKKIATGLNPWRLKQQFYDSPVERITEYLGQVDSYLDPILYLAALEEWFNIDIYVIVPTTESNITTMKFLIPRHTQFYAKNSVVKECMLILCHSGVQSDNLPYNHCEIIFRSEFQEDLVMGTDVSRRMRQIMAETTNTMVLSSNKLYSADFSDSSFDLIMAKYPIVSQYVDGYGKLRALTFYLADEDIGATIITEPREPYNVDHSDQISPMAYSEILNFCQTTPIGRSGLGVWIRLRKTSAIVYFRVLPADLLNTVFRSLEIIGTDPLLTKSDLESVVKTYAKKERDFSIITALLKWLLELYYAEAKEDYESFVEFYLGYSRKPVDEDIYYNTSLVKQVIPEVPDFSAAAEYVARVIPHVDEVFVLHNRAFYDKVRYMLMKHQRSIGIVSANKSQRIIAGFYRSIFDFKQQPKTQIYTNNVSIKDLMSKQNPFEITNMIAYDSSRRTPFVYQQAGKLYLIQNTILEDLSSALRVSSVWAAKGYNLGYSPKPMNSLQEIKSHSFVIFKIQNGTLASAYTNILDLEPLLFVLDYMVDVPEDEEDEEVVRKSTRRPRGTRTEDKSSRKRYAAVLPL